MKTPHPKQPQIDRFIESARALGADEDEAAFKEKLAVIARQTPKAEPVAAKRQKKKDRPE